jgi:hypothetical protein
LDFNFFTFSIGAVSDEGGKFEDNLEVGLTVDWFWITFVFEAFDDGTDLDCATDGPELDLTDLA